MASQPRTWASVGASKLARNQSRTAGEKGVSGSTETAVSTGLECTARPRFRPDVHTARLDAVPDRNRPNGLPCGPVGASARPVRGLEYRQVNKPVTWTADSNGRKGNPMATKRNIAAVLGGIA